MLVGFVCCVLPDAFAMIAALVSFFCDFILFCMHDPPPHNYTKTSPGRKLLYCCFTVDSKEDNRRRPASVDSKEDNPLLPGVALLPLTLTPPTLYFQKVALVLVPGTTSFLGRVYLCSDLISTPS